MDPMVVLIGTVLSASLVGSLHCAGMCGGLMLFALGAGDGLDKDQTNDGSTDSAPPKRSSLKYTKLKLQSAYHGGRLVTYTLLGIIAGTLGQALDFGGSFVGFQRSATVLAGVFMIAFGLMALARIRGLRIKHVRAPKFMQRAVERGQRFAFTLSPFKRAMMIGLLTTLLPCGWLYAFAFTAAGTGSPVWGGLTMSVFWLGTLPVMASLGAGIQLLAGPLHAKIPAISASAVVLVGAFTAMGRLQAPEMSRDNLNLVGNEVPTNPDAACPLCEAGLPMETDQANTEITGGEP
ncbi:MAG: sulfite exporter TauE/SafE family protein [Phycisphaerales bacterium]